MKLSEYGKLEVSVETSSGFVGSARVDVLLEQLGEDLEVHESSEAGRCLFLDAEQASAVNAVLE